MPTHRLTERVARDCRLSADDVAFLLEAHRAHVEVAPTGRRGSYRLTPKGHVGTIVAPRCRLVIAPKVPLRNLLYLLDPDHSPPDEADDSSVTGADGALDFLAGLLARLLAERAAAGLHRGYAERSDRLPFLHGSLDVAEQLRATDARKDRLACRYDEFTADLPCNQVPRTIGERVLRCPLLGRPIRAVLEQALQAFAAVRPISLGPDAFAAAEPDRQTAAYRPLIDLCRLLAQGFPSGLDGRSLDCPAFLLNMERVFERYVTGAVVRRFATHPGVEVRTQVLYDASRGQKLPLRPDVTVERGGRPMLVIDAKWKVGTASGPAPADLYQVLAYCTGLGVRHAILVYPGRRNSRRQYRLRHAPVCVEVCRLRVTGSIEACRRSLEKLGGVLGRRLRARNQPT